MPVPNSAGRWSTSIATAQASMVHPNRWSGGARRTRVSAPRMTSAVASWAGQSSRPRRAKFIPCHPLSQSVANAYRARSTLTRRRAAVAAIQPNRRPSRTGSSSRAALVPVLPTRLRYWPPANGLAARSLPSMSRRSLTLAVAGLAAIAAILVAVFVPVPYVILTPGPTLNTLGRDSSGQQLISITGHKTYATSGHLNLVTISYTGGPGSDLNVFQSLRAWLDPSEAVVPESELFPVGQTAQQTQTQDTQEMAGSQQQATAAALSYLHLNYQTQVQVAATVAGFPARQALKTGDIIESVDGTAITGDSSLSSVITAKPAGTVFQLEVLRAGRTLTVPVASKASG